VIKHKLDKEVQFLEFFKTNIKEKNEKYLVKLDHHLENFQSDQRLPGVRVRFSVPVDDIKHCSGVDGSGRIGSSLFYYIFNPIRI
jgi:hypothetical protein